MPRKAGIKDDKVLMKTRCAMCPGVRNPFAGTLYKAACTKKAKYNKRAGELSFMGCCSSKCMEQVRECLGDVILEQYSRIAQAFQMNKLVVPKLLRMRLHCIRSIIDNVSKDMERALHEMDSGDISGDTNEINDVTDDVRDLATCGFTYMEQRTREEDELMDYVSE